MGVEIVTKEDLVAFEKEVRTGLNKLIEGQREILIRFDRERMNSVASRTYSVDFISALEYMKAVGIKRWKFDQLIAGNKIKTIKKKRKIYVPVEEVKRYFMDPEVR
jgi:hypothetical protein